VRVVLRSVRFGLEAQAEQQQVAAQVRALLFFVGRVCVCVWELLKSVLWGGWVGGWAEA
jgi:hypothetical protein